MDEKIITCQQNLKKLQETLKSQESGKSTSEVINLSKYPEYIYSLQINYLE